MQVPIYAPTFNLCESYGRKASHLAAYIRDLGHDVIEIALDAETSGINYPTQPGGIILGYPTSFTEFGLFAQTGPRVCVTAWESSQVPPGWVNALNTFAAVSVGSQFVKDVFAAEGVQAPIRVHPLGVEAAFTWRPRPLQRPLIFLVFSDRYEGGVDRKGAFLALDAFVNAFGDRQDVHLVLKSRAGSKPIDVTNRNVTCLSADLTFQELSNLYAACDVMIFASKGEGFGIPPREFAATGGVPLVTDWGGLHDGVKQYAYPLKYTLEPAWKKDPWFAGQGGDWAKADKQDLMRKMIALANHDRVFLHHVGRKFSDYALQTYSWDRFARDVFATYQEVLEGSAVRI